MNELITEKFVRYIDLEKKDPYSSIGHGRLGA